MSEEVDQYARKIEAIQKETYRGEHSKAKQMLEALEREYSNITPLQTCQLLKLKTDLLIREGKYKTVERLTNQLNDIAKTLPNKLDAIYFQCIAGLQKATILRHSRQSSLAISHLNEVCSLLEKNDLVNHNRFIWIHSSTHRIRGIFEWIQKRYQNAYSEFLEAQRILQEHSSPLSDEAMVEYAWILNNLGVLHMNRGDLPQALEFLIKSLHLRETYHFEEGLPYSYGNLGRVTLKMGHATLALHYLSRAKLHAEKFSNPFVLREILFFTFLASLEANDLEHASNVLKQLETLGTESREQWARFNILIKAGEGLLKIHKKRLFHVVEGKRILQDLWENHRDEIEVEFHEAILLGLLKVTLFELTLFGDLREQEVMKTFQNLIDQFSHLALEINDYSMLCRSSWLKATYVLLENRDITSAKVHLMSALKIAKERGFEGLAWRLEQDLETLNDNQDLILHASDKDLIKILELQEAITTKFVSSQRKKETPIVILIFSQKTSELLYSNWLNPRDKLLDDNLLARLIHAINSALKHTFQINAHIELIQRDDFLIWTIAKENIVFAYAFEGILSGEAQQKLKAFAEKTMNTPQLRDTLIKTRTPPLPSDTILLLNQLSTDIFLQSSL